MFNTKAVLLMAITFTSCAMNNEDFEDRRTVIVKPDQTIAINPPHMDDVDVNSWVDIFYGKAIEAGILVNTNVKVRFAEDVEFKEDVIGVCTWYDTWEDVRLKKSWWMEEIRNCRRGMLVIHELGHCSFNLDHSEQGIMNPMLGFCDNNDEVMQMLVDLITEISEKK